MTPRAAAAPQPEYRALMMYDHLPDNCAAFMCGDESSLPHVRPGEWVILDTADRRPAHGELYVVSFGPLVNQQHICMARRRKNVGWLNQKYGPDGWSIGAIRNDEMGAIMDRLNREKNAGRLSHGDWARLALQAQTHAGTWVEGPYQDAGPSYEHLCDCIVGRIIGIYAPEFEEPKRTVQSGGA